MSNSNASRRSVSLTLPSTEKIMAACSALNWEGKKMEYKYKLAKKYLKCYIDL
jgi:hypothetical protein